jgi:hypothetical protein
MRRKRYLRNVFKLYPRVLCSFSVLDQRKEPKERAPSHSVPEPALHFSKRPALEETRFAQTVHKRSPDLSAMLDLMTMGSKKTFVWRWSIYCLLQGGLPWLHALQAEAHGPFVLSVFEKHCFGQQKPYGILTR